MKRARDAGARKLRQVPSGDTDGKSPSSRLSRRPRSSYSHHYSATLNILDALHVQVQAYNATRKIVTDKP